jgi:hypothetical protein
MYGIDSLKALELLKPNNYEVKAYWIPKSTGEIDEVFLYQDGTFITKATKYEKFNEAKIERTEDDVKALHKQLGRQAAFFKAEKDGIAEKINKNVVIDRKAFNYDAVVVETSTAQPDGPIEYTPREWTQEDDDDVITRALNY